MRTFVHLFVGAVPVCLVSLVQCAVEPTTETSPITSAGDLKRRIPRQLHITKPDYVVFVPEVTDTRAKDTGNEHFLVFASRRRDFAPDRFQRIIGRHRAASGGVGR